MMANAREMKMAILKEPEQHNVLGFLRSLDAFEVVIVVPKSGMGLEAQPGTYALLLSSTSDAEIRVGRHGDMRLRPGFYVYVGSALGPGGVRARVSHHLRDSPRPHWHIDYLRSRARVEEIWVCHGRTRQEHLWARLFSSIPGVSVPLRGFGASDCDCPAHVFYFESKAVHVRIREVLSARGVRALSL